MDHLRILSSAEQVAAYLRGRLENRVWSGMMPSVDKLARELGVGANTMEAALEQLEQEGLLENQGNRRGRKIHLQACSSQEGRMRISTLLGEASDRHQAYILKLANALEDDGNLAKFAPKTQEDMKGRVKQIARFAEESKPTP
jgi:DNA-binding transcriptional regulator YhcF (GntR family)